MILDLETLTELTGWEKEEIGNAMPTLLREIFPKGIELKVSTVFAGCSRAEPCVEEWLESVEQALRREGFYSPQSFEWQQNQYFELVKYMYAGANYDAIIRVKAFLDGMVTAEVKPRHLTELASRILNATLDKYNIPYETEIPVETAKNPLLPIMISGLATLILFGLSASE